LIFALDVFNRGLNYQVLMKLVFQTRYTKGSKKIALLPKTRKGTRWAFKISQWTFSH
jgi:hypothetical protein